LLLSSLDPTVASALIAGIVSLCLGGIGLVSAVTVAVIAGRKNDDKAKRRVDAVDVKFAEQLDTLRLESARKFERVDSLWELFMDSARRQSRAAGMIAANSPEQPTDVYFRSVPAELRGQLATEIEALVNRNGLGAYDLAIEVYMRKRKELIEFTNGGDGVSLASLLGVILTLCERALDEKKGGSLVS